MTAAERDRIAAAEARTRRAEVGELDARIQLAILRQQIHAHETAEAKLQRKLIQPGVEKLVATGTVHPGDHFGQFRVLEQLALGHPRDRTAPPLHSAQVAAPKCNEAPKGSWGRQTIRFLRSRSPASFFPCAGGVPHLVPVCFFTPTARLRSRDRALSRGKSVLFSMP